MITQSTIDKIKDVQLSEVVGTYIKLTHKGVNYQACCPFHHEKTPSFSVNDVKGIYKCFGCGAGGNVIDFVMQHDKLTFVEAIAKIASIVKMEVEYEQETEADKEKRKKQLSEAEAQEKVLNLVIPIYQQQLADLPMDHPAKIWAAERFDDDVLAQWKIGWAPNDWRFITPILIKENLFFAAEQLGIIKRGANDSNYDGYRSRIIIPIQNKLGKTVGIAGRYIKISDTDASEIAKWINPSECAIYNKKDIVFGLYNAAKAIKEKDEFNLVEGYADVIVPQSNGFQNTVGICGTAFTDDQQKILRKHSKNVNLWLDADSSGIKAALKYIPELVKSGFNVNITPIVDAKDPDEFVRKNKSGVIELEKVDAIDWYAHKMYGDIDDPKQKALSKAMVLKLVRLIPNEIIQNYYLDTFCKLYKWKSGDTKKEFNNIIPPKEELELEEDTKIRYPPWMDEEQQEDFMKTGYVSVNRKEKGKPMVGYYSFNQNGKVEISNFTVTPLFRIEAGQDSRYLSKVNNGYREVVVDMPAKIYPSIEQFQGMCIAAGGSFLIYGNKNQWLRIATDLLHKYPSCHEITELGWQPKYNFWAFVDKVWLPGLGLHDLDEYGIVKHQDNQYLIAAASAIYVNQHSGPDPYQHLRVLSYSVSSLNFSQWCKKMHIVYGDKGVVGIAYAILTMFRDVVFSVDNNCPHLYGFGEPSSGKSKWAESICALFFKNRAAFNLNSGTDFAFFVFMSTFANCPAHLNEFDIEVIKMEWFEATKGAYDGEGRQRGKMGVKNAVETQQIVSTLILTGQKLVTYNDNSIVTRSIIEGFAKEEHTDAAKEAYIDLKSWEEKGLNSILLELLSFRQKFVERYKENLNNQLSIWRKNRKDARGLNQRILTNWAHLFTCYAMVNESIPMPQSLSLFEDYCFNRASFWSNFITSTDTLAEFWRSLEAYVNNNELIEGWDFVVENCYELPIRSKSGDNITFEQATPILFLRVNIAHQKFQKDYRSRTGKEAMTLDNIMHYFSSRKYFLGPIKNKIFKRIVYKEDVTEKTEPFTSSTSQQITGSKRQEIKKTSCYAFVYNDLNIDIANNQNYEQPFESMVADIGNGF